MKQALDPTRSRLLSLCGLDRRWVRGEGVWLKDDQGQRFLDCCAQYGAVVLGHNPPKVVEALQEFLATQQPAMVQPFPAAHAEALARELVQRAPGELAHCVFTSSGSEAVEAAIKLVRARTGRPLILSAEGGFHGKTLGALAATGGRHAVGFGPLPSGFDEVPFGDLEALARYLARNGEQVAALLLEPIQGEYGIRPAPPGYLAGARELCSQHGVALVLDEVQTGLGRTGAWFACESEGVEPDLLLLAKSLGGGLVPLGACLVTPAFWQDHFGLSHSSTFANNNLACCVGRAVLRQLEQTELCPAVARKGRLLRGLLAGLARRHPRLIAEVRGRGLMWGIELREIGAGEGALISILENHQLYAHAVAAVIAQQQLLVLPTPGPAPVLRISPPLIIRESELSLAVEKLDLAFTELAANRSQTILRTLRSDRPVQATPVHLPAPRKPQARPVPRYAFLVHPADPSEMQLTNPGLDASDSGRFYNLLGQLPPVLMCDAPRIRSASGALADGSILLLGLRPHEMRRQGIWSVSRQIAAAVDLARHLGASIVGLAGHTTPFSRHGTAVTGRGPGITTGNALTAGMALAATQDLALQQGLLLEDSVVAVVGARGSLGGLLSRLLARAGPRRLLLLGSADRGRQGLRRLQAELSASGLPVEASTDIARLRNCQIVISATSASGPVLPSEFLAPGTLVCDLARPRDACPEARARDDLLVFDGGQVRLPQADACFGIGNLIGLPDGVQMACLAETILLTLARRTGNHSLGRRIPLAWVDELMLLAEAHGFSPVTLAARQDNPDARRTA